MNVAYNAFVSNQGHFIVQPEAKAAAFSNKRVAERMAGLNIAVGQIQCLANIKPPPISPFRAVLSALVGL